MLAFIAIKYHDDHRHRLLVEAIATALEQCGVMTQCVVRDLEQWGTRQFDPSELMQLTFRAIEASSFMVLDLTEKGVGLGIEAGYAYAQHKPIVVIARAGSDISTTLAAIAQDVFHYTHPDELVHYFQRVITHLSRG